VPETALPASDLDLISALKAVPDARMKRGHPLAPIQDLQLHQEVRLAAGLLVVAAAGQGLADGLADAGTAAFAQLSANRSSLRVSWGSSRPPIATAPSVQQAVQSLVP
jgi:hypothetical protein